MNQIKTSVNIVLAHGDGRPVPLTMIFSQQDEPVRMPEHVVIYVDEQGGLTPKTGKSFAIGLQFGSQPWEAETMKPHLSAREHSLPTHRCIDRPYFHATDDCWPCRKRMVSIIEAVSQQYFVSLRWTFAKARSCDPLGGALYTEALHMAASSPLQFDGVKRISFRHEQLSEVNSSLKRFWQRGYIDEGLRFMVTYPGIPIQFPAVDAEEVDKTEPGVQVCDHLLWRERRELARGDVLLSDTGYLPSHTIGPAGPMLLAHYRKGTAMYPSRVPHRETAAGFPSNPVGMLWAAEAQASALSDSRAELAHLASLVADARSIASQERRSWPVLETQLRNLLTLLHTAPLFDSFTDRLGFAQLASMMLRGQDGRVPSLFTEWRHPQGVAPP
jgi:hypothetical protein